MNRYDAVSTCDHVLLLAASINRDGELTILRVSEADSCPAVLDNLTHILVKQNHIRQGSASVSIRDHVALQ